MESFGASLEPYSQHLQQLVMVLTCVKLLRIFKIPLLIRTGTCSDNFPLKSWLGALIHAGLDMRVAQLTGDATMMMISSSSLILNVTLLTLLYRHASPVHKSRIFLRMLVIIMLLVLCLSYSIIDDPTTVLCFLNIWRTLTACLLVIIGLRQGTDAALGCFMATLLAASKLLLALSTVDNSCKNSHTLMVFLNLIVLILNLLRIVSIIMRNPRLSGILAKLPISKRSSNIRLRSTVSQIDLSSVTRMNLSRFSLSGPQFSTHRNRS